MNYLQLGFTTEDEVQREMLVAQLSAAGFGTFEEKESLLVAGIEEQAFNAPEVAAIAARVGVSYTQETIPQTNWNAIWESSFEPVIVEGFCAVRASFHPPVTDVPYEIIITPKMSFGTGHHATTRLMLEAMRGIDFRGKRVLDFGTGTGILAILAAKLGASSVTAIDNDEWSVLNAAENIKANEKDSISMLQGSLEVAGSAPFDLILANINRHILIRYMPRFPALLRPGGILLLSGILAADREVIGAAATEARLTPKRIFEEGGWIAMAFSL